MGQRWRQRVVVLTGASSGIGRASALRLARKGAALAGGAVALAARASRRRSPRGRLARALGH